MITTFIVVQTIDLYHLHLVYDTVSFVGYVLVPSRNSMVPNP